MAALGQIVQPLLAVVGQNEQGFLAAVEQTEQRHLAALGVVELLLVDFLPGSFPDFAQMDLGRVEVSPAFLLTQVYGLWPK